MSKTDIMDAFEGVINEDYPLKPTLKNTGDITFEQLPPGIQKLFKSVKHSIRTIWYDTYQNRIRITVDKILKAKELKPIVNYKNFDHLRPSGGGRDMAIAFWFYEKVNVDWLGQK